MFAKRVNELTERKRLLVLEADLHRSLVGLECANLRFQLKSELTSIRAVSPWRIAGGTMAGLLVARCRRGDWIPGVLAVWRWVRRLK